jgi:hypothetical protein
MTGWDSVLLFLTSGSVPHLGLTGLVSLVRPCGRNSKLLHNLFEDMMTVGDFGK